MATTRSRQEQLAGALTHVAYCIAMLRGTTKHWIETPPEDWVTRSAFIESFLVAFRALHHFFVPYNPRAGDARADWYTFDGAWKAKVESPWLGSREVLDRISKTLAHITDANLSMHPGGDKSWKIPEMHRAMEQLIEQFRGALDTGQWPEAWLDREKIEVRGSSCRLKGDTPAD